jgi:hypothetical protein
MNGFVLAASAAVCCGSAWAGEMPAAPTPVLVQLLAPISYSSAAPAPAWIKEDCHVERLLELALSKALADRSLGGATTTTRAQGAVLEVTIERVIGQAGGGWSGDKTVSIHLSLLQDGQLQRSTDQTVATKSLNPLAGTCASFERAADKMGGLAVRWLAPPPSSRAKPAAPPRAVSEAGK